MEIVNKLFKKTSLKPSNKLKIPALVRTHSKNVVL